MRRCKRSARRWCAGILIASLSFWSGGCGRRVVYVSGTRRVVKLDEGQPAPAKGVWMSEAYLSEIYEALGRRAAEDKR